MPPSILKIGRRRLMQMACLQGLHTLYPHNFGHNDVVGASNIMPAEWAFFHHKENDNNNKSQV